jgi:FkbM family methyltransferase
LGDGLFIDVGANFGWYSCLLNRLDSQRTILAFEPEPDNYRLLQQQLALNDARSVQALHLGLGAAPGQLTMHKYKQGNSGRHSLLPLHGGERVTVDIVTLDAQLATMELSTQPIALMKMDIEGYELFAMQGARQALTRTRHIVMEFSPQLMRQAQLNPDELLELLQHHGFAAQLFDDQMTAGPKPISYDELRALGREGRQFDLLLVSDRA